jgi:hypothetical protein
VYVFLFVLFSCFDKTEESEVEILHRPEEEDEEQEIDEEQRIDIDQDGYSVEDGDCDDWDPNIHPDAIEIWNYEDDNCDGYEDIDGIHAGELSLQAVGIYEGVSYYFEQQCTGEIERIEGHLSLVLMCIVDQQQEKANLLLGGTISVTKEADFVLEEEYYESILFSSVEGDMEWDASGDVGLVWSSLEDNGGDHINVLAVLDALYLDIQIIGVLDRQ